MESEFHNAAYMKQFKAPLELDKAKTQHPVRDQVLIRVAGAGICHSDVHVWEGVWQRGGAPEKLPHILSHEISGTVVEKGEDVPETIKIGSKVLVYAWQWKFDDHYTVRGLTNVANTPSVPGINIDGGFQEYFLVSHYKYLIDANGIDDLPAIAPLSCGGLTTYRAVKKAASYIEPDDFVAVVGLGGLGSYAVQYIRLIAPFANIIGIDTRDESIEFVSKISRIDHSVNAKKTDVSSEIKKITGRRGLKAVIDLVGKGTLTTYSDLMGKESIYVIVGLMGTDREQITSLNTVLFEKTVTGSYVGTIGEQMEVINLARKGLIDYRSPVSRRLNLSEASEGILNLENQKALGRQVVIP
ncbi:alcohol dehydrogenase catalytic domain-containing protein [Thermoplasma sp.]|uniref:alcohol dehydrogenase catalytic domain-containing protein n=1 Tax=Thermoplasma sp. TaxID=1973142 RepID=UPI00127081C2|nr:alcohol dehydrogenase catalytic domain-containing protein [Thermoplasma sp.]KAA8922247.1 MAG: alcohol dehydrogenase catalytic domain-containing protein [Thermoplasma sp.]